ncbi:ATP-binding protein [Nonomuraea thailandensis]
MRSLNVSETCIADMLLAVSEACSNAVRHGGPANRYEVTAAIGAGQCDVRVADNGDGVPTMPHSFPPPDTENGRGLLIMRSVVDEISFGVTPAGAPRSTCASTSPGTTAPTPVPASSPPSDL